LRGITRSGGQLIGVLALQQVLSAHELSSAIAAWRAH
jgi:DNA-binding transcriptional regulator GbsR (MarR family)